MQEFVEIGTSTVPTTKVSPTSKPKYTQTSMTVSQAYLYAKELEESSTKTKIENLSGLASLASNLSGMPSERARIQKLISIGIDDLERKRGRSESGDFEPKEHKREKTESRNQMMDIESVGDEEDDEVNAEGGNNNDGNE
jgi:hypothetical protein